jgi:hypothetical protein
MPLKPNPPRAFEAHWDRTWALAHDYVQDYYGFRIDFFKVGPFWFSVERDMVRKPERAARDAEMEEERIARGMGDSRERFVRACELGINLDDYDPAEVAEYRRTHTDVLTLEWVTTPCHGCGRNPHPTERTAPADPTVTEVLSRCPCGDDIHRDTWPLRRAIEPCTDEEVAAGLERSRRIARRVNPL